MLLSHKDKIIYVKSIKTAGTSVEVFLEVAMAPHRFTGEWEDLHDVSLLESDGLVRTARMSGGLRHGRWHTVAPLRRQAVAPLRRQAVALLDKLGLGGLLRRVKAGASAKQAQPLYNHMPPSEIVAAFGPNCWQDYTTCTVVRNPWDRMVSWFTWSHKNDPGFRDWNRKEVVSRFEDFCVNFKQSKLDFEIVHFTPPIDVYFKYENLESDVRAFIRRTGLDDSALPFPTLKSGVRDERFTDTRSLFTDTGLRALKKVYGDYAERFHYSFND